MEASQRRARSRRSHEQQGEKFYGSGVEGCGDFRVGYMNYGLCEEGVGDYPLAAENHDVRAAVPPQPLARREALEESGRIHSLLEHGATWLFPFLFGSGLLLSYQRLSEIAAEWLAIPGVLFGLVFGDLLTGLVHWAADTYGDERTPVIGRSLVKPFRVHHVRPREICEHGIVETMGNACILAAPLLALLLALAARDGSSAAAAFVLFTAFMTVGVTVATNQFHKWAHQAEPPRLVRALQRSRIILNPEHHRTHHTAPFESSYAITNGWLNPLLNRTGFFRRLEDALRAFGIEPSIATPRPEGKG